MKTKTYPTQIHIIRPNGLETTFMTLLHLHTHQNPNQSKYETEPAKRTLKELQNKYNDRRV